MFKKYFKKILRCAVALAVVFPVFTASEPGAFAASRGGITDFAVDLSGAELGGGYGGGSLEADESGFAFTLEAEEQNGGAFVKFPVMLPQGKLLSDYERVEFTLRASGSYDFGGVLAMPRGSFPETVDYDYDGMTANNAVNVTEATDEPEDGSVAGFADAPEDDSVTGEAVEPEERVSAYDLNINRDEAALIGTRALEFSVFISMAQTEAAAWYEVSGMTLIPAAKPLDNATVKVTGISLDTDIKEDSALLTLSRALKEGETLTLQAFDERHMGLGTWTRNSTEYGKFVFEEVDTADTMSLIAYVHNRRLENRTEYTNTLFKDSLDSLITEAKAYTPEDYANGEALTEAIEEASGVSENKRAGNKDYEKTRSALEDVLASLEPIAD